MSRPVAGLRNKTLILTLPGSPKGAKENLESVLKLLPHACVQASGADSRALHAGGLQKLEQDAGIVSSIGSSTQSNQSPHHHHHHHGGCGGHHAPTSHTKPSDRPPASNDPGAGPSNRHRESPYPMLTVADALRLITTKTPPPTATTLPVNSHLIGHVLAADVTARESVPAFRASLVDGYAIRHPPSGVFAKGTYPLSQISHARAAHPPPLPADTIARITTGAPLPPCASAVVMVEDTALASRTPSGAEEAAIAILTSALQPGENVREIGSDVAAGAPLLRAGTRVGAAEVGLLAGTGAARVAVYAKPVVGVLSTGDELVDAGAERALAPGEVRDSNRPALLACMRAAGFEARDLGVAADAAGALEAALRDGIAQCTHVVTTGGVSMGELDLVKAVVERGVGGEIHFGRVAMKPGKPTTFATVGVKDAARGERTAVVFGLPGNPASALVTFAVFVLPSLHTAAGVVPVGLPRVVVTLDEFVGFDRARPEFHRCVVSARGDGRLYASSTGGQRSSRIGSFAGANGLLCLPAGRDCGREGAEKGEQVEALLMGWEGL